MIPVSKVGLPTTIAFTQALTGASQPIVQAAVRLLLIEAANDRPQRPDDATIRSMITQAAVEMRERGTLERPYLDLLSSFITARSPREVDAIGYYVWSNIADRVTRVWTPAKRERNGVSGNYCAPEMATLAYQPITGTEDTYPSAFWATHGPEQVHRWVLASLGHFNDRAVVDTRPTHPWHCAELKDLDPSEPVVITSPHLSQTLLDLFTADDAASDNGTTRFRGTDSVDITKPKIAVWRGRSYAFSDPEQIAAKRLAGLRCSAYVIDLDARTSALPKQAAPVDRYYLVDHLVVTGHADNNVKITVKDLNGGYTNDELMSHHDWLHRTGLPDHRH